MPDLFGSCLPGYSWHMPNSAGERATAGDRAAELDEQVAQGHEWATDAKPNSSGDLHSDAAAEHRQAAGKGRAEAESARNDSETDPDD